MIDFVLNCVQSHRLHVPLYGCWHAALQTVHKEDLAVIEKQMDPGAPELGAPFRANCSVIVQVVCALILQYQIKSKAISLLLT